MQLIQIGVAKPKTVLDIVMEMAERQSAEMERLKASAYERSATKRVRRARQRCGSANRDL